MSDRLQNNLAALRQFVAEKNWEIFEERAIQSGLQVDVLDNTSLCKVNLYETGKILVQGRESSLKIELQAWADQQSPPHPRRERADNTQHEPYRYIVESVLHGDVLQDITNNFTALYENPPVSTQVYMLTVQENQHSVKVIQYRSGTLMVQGAPSPLLNRVVEFLNNHPGVEPYKKNYLQLADDYLKKNGGEKLSQRLSDFDWQGIRSATALLIAAEDEEIALSDYSVLIMPFYRALEGFITTIRQLLNTDESHKMRDCLSKIEQALGRDSREVHEAIDQIDILWSKRNRVFHSESTPISLTEAQMEINLFLHAISQLNKILNRRGY